MNLKTATPREVDEAIADLEGQVWKQRMIAQDAIESVHHAAGDRQEYHGRQLSWKMNDVMARETLLQLLTNDDEHFLSVGGRAKVEKLIPSIEAAVTEIARLDVEIQKLESEFNDRGGWSRFHQLRSTGDARIHGTRWCSGLYRSDLGDLGWHPELSGKSEEEAVAELGPVMCSKCFRSAPAEWKQNPKDLRVDPNACPGGEKAPVEGTVKRFSNWQGVGYWGTCTGCGVSKKLRQDSKIVKHVKPKGK